MDLQEVIRRDQRTTARGAIVEFELEFVHRATVLNVHFFAFPVM